MRVASSPAVERTKGWMDGWMDGLDEWIWMDGYGWSSCAPSPHDSKTQRPSSELLLHAGPRCFALPHTASLVTTSLDSPDNVEEAMLTVAELTAAAGCVEFGA